MKIKNSSIPYLLLLFALLVVIPLIDHQMTSEYSIEINLESKENQFDDQFVGISPK